MDIKIFNHTQNNEVVVRYVANNGTHQINMQTLVENKMSVDEFKKLAIIEFNKVKTS